MKTFSFAKLKSVSLSTVHYGRRDMIYGKVHRTRTSGGTNDIGSMDRWRRERRERKEALNLDHCDVPHSNGSYNVLFCLFIFN